MKRKIVYGILFVFMLLQLFTPSRENPPISAPLEIKDNYAKHIIERSCFDCHSNATIWPLYSKIAPISYFIAMHVYDGRNELNFSEFESYPVKKKIRKWEELIEEVKSGNMPMKPYLLMHSEKELTEKELVGLIDYANSQIHLLKQIQTLD